MTYVGSVAASFVYSPSNEKIGELDPFDELMQYFLNKDGSIKDSNNAFFDDVRGNYGTVVDNWGDSNFSGNMTASKLAQIAQKDAASLDTVGWCLRGVNNALEDAYGFRLSYESAYMAAPALRKKSNLFKEVQVPRSELPNLPAGAIVVWGRNSKHPHGHISIALGDGREASDHIQKQCMNISEEYSVFIPISA